LALKSTPQQYHVSSSQGGILRYLATPIGFQLEQSNFKVMAQPEVFNGTFAHVIYKASNGSVLDEDFCPIYLGFNDVPTTVENLKALLKDQVESEESWKVIAQATMRLEHVGIIWSNAITTCPSSSPVTRMTGTYPFTDINVPRILGVMAARRWIDHFRLEYRAHDQVGQRLGG
jgi:hypothetical protein